MGSKGPGSSISGRRREGAEVRLFFLDPNPGLRVPVAGKGDSRSCWAPRSLNTRCGSSPKSIHVV